MAIANDETQPYGNRDKAADVCSELAASDVASALPIVQWRAADIAQRKFRANVEAVGASPRMAEVSS